MAVMRRLPRAIGLSVLLLTSSAASSKAQPLLTPSIRQSYEVGTGDRELVGIRDLYFTPSGGLVVLDQDMVLIFDAGGNERYTWGRMGDGPGEFRSPLSVAANDSIVLVGEACQPARKMSRLSALKMSRFCGCPAEGAERPERGSGPERE